ncbi:unnamed protein product, partial [Phytomonas sp. EM1]
MFRVSAEGCLTVRNFLLLNPRRIDEVGAADPAAGAAIQAAGASGTRGTPHHLPASSLTPSEGSWHSCMPRASVVCDGHLIKHVPYSPIQVKNTPHAANSGYYHRPPGGEILKQPLLRTTRSAYTLADSVNNSFCHPISMGPSLLAARGGQPHTAHLHHTNSTTTHPATSFTLFSASMDTLYSPITYTFDDARFPSANPTHEGGTSTRKLRNQRRLLRAVREEDISSSSILVPHHPLAGHRPVISHGLNSPWLKGAGSGRVPTSATSMTRYPHTSAHPNIGYGSYQSSVVEGLMPPHASSTHYRSVDGNVEENGGTSLLLPYIDALRRQTDAYGGATAPLPNVVRYTDLDVKMKIGEGASASVYVAIHLPTGRRLAVKRIDLSLLCLDILVEHGEAANYLKFSSGCGRVRQLQHIVTRELQVLHLTYRSPFMVKVYNAFYLHESATLDIVMEFMHYGSLNRVAKCLQEYSRSELERQQYRRRLLTPTESAANLSQMNADASDRVASDGGRLVEGPEGPLFRPATRPFGPGKVETPVPLLEESRSRARSGVAWSAAHSPAPTNGSMDFPYYDDAMHSSTAGSPCGGGGGRRFKPAREPWDDESVRSNAGTEDEAAPLDTDGSGCIEEAFGIAERVVAVFGEQLLRGVRDMHERGYIHRDIKLGNVLVNEHGVVKLSDFGLSQRCDSTGMGIANRHHWSQPRRARKAAPSAAPPTPAAGRSFSGSQELRRRSSLSSIGSDLSMDAGEGKGEGDCSENDGMDMLDASSTASSDSNGGGGAHGEDEGGEERHRRGEHSTSYFPRGNNDDDEEEEGDILCSGTTLYMSPERQRGEPHGKPCDIWAVGVTLAEFAVGEYPYDLEGCVDDFDRMQRMGRPIDFTRFNLRRKIPLSPVFQDFIRLATLPVASQRPTAGELLEHPFFRQWSRPFYLKEYLRSRIPMPSNKFKEEYLAAKRAAAAVNTTNNPDNAGVSPTEFRG